MEVRDLLFSEEKILFLLCLTSYNYFDLMETKHKKYTVMGDNT